MGCGVNELCLIWWRIQAVVPSPSSTWGQPQNAWVHIPEEKKVNHETLEQFEWCVYHNIFFIKWIAWNLLIRQNLKSKLDYETKGKHARGAWGGA